MAGKGGSSGSSGAGKSSGSSKAPGGKSATPRKVYDVNPRPDDRWEGKVEGGRRASVVRDTKKETIKDTKQLAKKGEPSQIRIKREDGTIQTEYTYGKDPEKTPG